MGRLNKSESKSGPNSGRTWPGLKLRLMLKKWRESITVSNMNAFET